MTDMPYRSQLDAMAARIDDLVRELGETREEVDRLRGAHARAMNVLRMLAEQRKISDRLDKLIESERPPAPDSDDT